MGKSPFTAGTKSEAIIKPSIKGQIIFYIRDENREWIEVPVDYRHIGKMVGDEHTTRVANGKGDVIHTEHLLSALSGMGIDSCDIYLMRDN